MNFTREPIIETIITPKDGHKLAIRSSKGSGGEEFIVESVEVISFGMHAFYRSQEKPKAFIVPVSDYEILEVRETKMVLKMPDSQRGGIKIGGGREPSKPPRELKEEQEEEVSSEEVSAEPKSEKRRDKKRFRKRKDRAQSDEEGADILDKPFSEEPAEAIKPEEPKAVREHVLIPPPTTLISETIGRYKDTPNFAGAFFEKEEAIVVKEEAPVSERGDEELFPHKESEIQIAVEEQEEDVFPKFEED